MLTLASAPSGAASCGGCLLLPVGFILAVYGLVQLVVLFISRHEPQTEHVPERRAKALKRALICLAIGVGLLLLDVVLLNLSAV